MDDGFCFDMMTQYPPSMAATVKLQTDGETLPENFAWYAWEALGQERPWRPSGAMKVVGAQFRKVAHGNARRWVLIPKTQKTVFVSKSDIRAVETQIKQN